MPRRASCHACYKSALFDEVHFTPPRRDDAVCSSDERHERQSYVK